MRGTSRLQTTITLGKTARDIALPATWKPQPRWDLLRVQVEVGAARHLDDSAQELISLRPFAGRASWNIQHNIFNVIAAEFPSLYYWELGITGVIVLVMGVTLLHAWRESRR